MTNSYSVIRKHGKSPSSGKEYGTGDSLQVPPQINRNEFIRRMHESMVANLKLEGIDERAPPGVEPDA